MPGPLSAGGHRSCVICVSAGLKVLAQKVPEGLVTGSLPASCLVAAPAGSARKKTSPKGPPTRAENKWRFSADDLQKIKYYLEEEHLPSDAASKSPGQTPSSLSPALPPSLCETAARGRGFGQTSQSEKVTKACAVLSPEDFSLGGTTLGFLRAGRYLSARSV